MPSSCYWNGFNFDDPASSIGVRLSRKFFLLLIAASLLLSSNAVSRPRLEPRNSDDYSNNLHPSPRGYREQYFFTSVFSPDKRLEPSIPRRLTDSILTTIPRGGAASTKKLGKSKQKKNNAFNNVDDDQSSLLILIRIMFFAYYASLGSLLPYLPVYYHSLGHGGQIIGMLGAIKPFITFLVAPLWGVISDQTGSPFTVLYFTFLVSLVGQLGVSWRHDPSWIMAMIFVTAFFNAPVKSLIDSMVMSNLKDGKLYGRLRLWGQLGFGVGSSVVGVLLSKSQEAQKRKEAMGDVVLTTAEIIFDTRTIMEKLSQIWQKISGYKLLFFAHAILSIPTLVCIRAFDRWTKTDKPAATKRIQRATNNEKGGVGKTNEYKPNVLQGIQVLFHNRDALLFFFLVLVVGISSGVIENFAYVRIREVGGSGHEMGLSRLVSSMAGAPMFWFSGPLTELLGADKVLAISLMNYVIRFFNYAFMQSPLQGLPAEALRGATFAAFWSTCTIYASRISPPGMQATMVRNQSKYEVHVCFPLFISHLCAEFFTVS